MEITVIDHRHNVYIYEPCRYILYSNAPICLFPDPVGLFSVVSSIAVYTSKRDLWTLTFTMKNAFLLLVHFACALFPYVHAI